MQNIVHASGEWQDAGEMKIYKSKSTCDMRSPRGVTELTSITLVGKCANSATWMPKLWSHTPAGNTIFNLVTLALKVQVSFPVLSVPLINIHYAVRRGVTYATRSGVNYGVLSKAIFDWLSFRTQTSTFSIPWTFQISHRGLSHQINSRGEFVVVYVAYGMTEKVRKFSEHPITRREW